MRLARLVILLLGTAAACELAARAVLDPRGFASPRAERAAFLARLPGGGESEEDLERTRAAVRRAYGSDFELHPLFGYTFRHAAAGANNHGFFAGGASYPYRAAPDELVIGVFGGSVAMQVAAAPGPLLERVHDAVAARGWKRVTVLPFAVGGWRQPQTFQALVYFLDSIDVAIVLDGFNEVIHLGDAALERQPAAFPWSEVYVPLVRAPSPAETLVRAEILRAHAIAARVTRLLERPVLRNSALAHLAWRAAAAEYERRVAGARRALTAEATPFADVEPPSADPGGVEARRAAYLSRWEELTRLAHVIASEQGRPFLHFVQPNQYDRGAKPLSAEERTLHTRNAPWFDEVTPRYRLAEEMTARLRSRGVESHFLGRIFATTEETVYVDECCHLNARGVALLNAAIAERLVASGLLAVLPRVPHTARLSPEPRHASQEGGPRSSGG